MEIGSQISNQLENCSLCFVYPELDWIIDEHTVVRPDLMVVCQYVLAYPEIVKARIFN